MEFILLLIEHDDVHNNQVFALFFSLLFISLDGCVVAFHYPKVHKRV